MPDQTGNGQPRGIHKRQGHCRNHRLAIALDGWNVDIINGSSSNASAANRALNHHSIANAYITN